MSMIRKLRVDHNKTPAEVAAALGISEARYLNLEYGRKKLEIPMAIALADYFGVTLDFLLEHHPRRPDPILDYQEIRLIYAYRGAYQHQRDEALKLLEAHLYE